MIEDYSFGKMKIDGRVYNSDVIIYPGRVDATWWRDEGHLLQPQDLKTVISEKPKMIVIGTGFFGMMKLDEKTKMLLKKEKIEFEADKTSRAVELFNNTEKIKKVVGLFHLTC